MPCIVKERIRRADCGLLLIVNTYILVIYCFNPRPAGGGIWTHPHEFFVNNLKTERHRFWHTLSYIFSAHVVKISDAGYARSERDLTS